MVNARAPSPRQAWRNELKDIVRGVAGGFLFGIPLVYTMEVWWIGSYTNPPLMLSALAVNLIVLLLLIRTDGFRRNQLRHPSQLWMDSIEALAIGTVCVTLMLILLREITGETPLDEALGKIIFESVPFTIGVALARTLLSGDQEQSQPPSGRSPTASPPQKLPPAEIRSAMFADMGATVIGAIFVAFNIAPTDEVSMLAAAASAPWLLGIIAASLIVSYGIVFVAGLTAQQKRLEQQGAFHRPLVETVVSYLISLLAAALMLWFFHRLSPDDPWTLWLRFSIILGLPATVGGAAGRLAI